MSSLGVNSHSLAAPPSWTRVRVSRGLGLPHYHTAPIDKWALIQPSLEGGLSPIKPLKDYGGRCGPVVALT